jgi:hypothetical protein
LRRAAHGHSGQAAKHLSTRHRTEQAHVSLLPGLLFLGVDA